ncbi:electron transport complex subunit RsxC [Oceanotoga sp. DSM 15011]|jgi:electron transport complex protein RnfC|uniref:electron transport complex subunit RsxC n=1 Tax=Oceanotoga TaxID=1255275 RepID=UPI0021F4DBD2|nr:MULTISPECIES: electron transport complex subunit RsxC [Oceanotoga]MDN5342913.1 H+/Na+-translocating ferredoxin:NAD+ oxidoreductase subunit [Oceanotoga sp.]MDO7975369.1 electron transport complex subunit RsxC [Oceanotoga teriensis]UYP00127.1 electron transport complex subunit RsxC [Oceanotoga sp. DSM 15011]
MGFLTFRGGVHPSEKKEMSQDQEIKVLKLPDTVYMYTSNHLGAPAKPIVEVGEKVKTGQKIAEASGFISANLHSPLTGEIVSIEKMVNAASGRKDDVIVIKKTSEDDWQLLPHNDDFTKFTSEEIINNIKEAGIVGLGGAMFPSHVKLMIPKGKKAETLIINAAECEPYITIDERMMLEKTDEIIKGIEILLYASGIEKAYIGIEENKPKAIKTMIEKTNGKNIEIKTLKTKYPQGAEKQLINAITSKEVPSGGLPIDIGVIVFNVSTTYAIYDAIINGKPLVERGASLTGEGVKKPGNFLYRIGTKVNELLENVGLIDEENIDRILYGGPMMGIPLPNIELPTFKGNNAITVLTKDILPKREDFPCIRCSSCVSVCPIGLQPYLLKKYSDTRNYDTALENGLMDCIECGSCSFICPSNIELAKSFKTAKKVVRAMKQRRG